MEAAAELPQEDMAVTRAAGVARAAGMARVAVVKAGVLGKLRLFQKRR